MLKIRGATPSRKESKSLSWLNRLWVEGTRERTFGTKKGTKPTSCSLPRLAHPPFCAEGYPSSTRQLLLHAVFSPRETFDRHHHHPPSVVAVAHFHRFECQSSLSSLEQERRRGREYQRRSR